MSTKVENLLNDAKELSPVDRAHLIELLFETFNRTPSRDVDEAWKTEIDSRLEAYDRGELKASSMEDVMKRINQR